ncbi:16S rRNA (adenine(1518)-N(6)/adenine(1519)-N(6))-dimethyltransferase RsmA [Tautonia plasticadhaerens]|uniref:Ribosomal RNA small subunit methyltransferase A n=1 Tax=Tautonia plasticadhaerens TaxID=2527974 RepID=A0A518HDC2_9BACT|nr:16S rRNA (adenine(1518)-N(6)/adenine(1519)-N(6))-dimethyltransferase RsmA [Tautonia plasticadhaerens]QDV38854.1 Ribosomal RNA adenine dimethylase [Tautonia plasticadhaerens]
MTTPRQTLTYLRHLFDHRGIRPNRRYGQNFLIDLNTHDLIARSAEIGPEDVILEVGPGAGALTTLMAEKASAVVTVEIDPAMARLTREATSGLPNVRVLQMDALARKHEINPEVLDNLRAGLAVAPDRRLKLVANLPYNVATPIIGNLLVHPELCPGLIVVTIQRELADRMLAEPHSEAYGALSVTVQALADAELVRILSPKVFWPRPKVESAIIKITPNAGKRAAIPDLPWFHDVVRRVFTLRRKNLRVVLYSLWRHHWSGKPQVDALLESIDLTGDVRAEALNVQEFIDLAEALRTRLGPSALELPDPDDTGSPEYDYHPDDEGDGDGDGGGDGPDGGCDGGGGGEG